VSQPSINLTAKVGSQASAAVRIANHGKGVLEGSISGPVGSPFSSTGTGPFTFSHDGSRRVKITFKPTAAGKFSSELTITSDDPEHPSVNVPITGTAD
jgi:hypothetical protein